MLLEMTHCKTPPQAAQRFHNLTGVTVGSLVKSGGRFSPAADLWRFPDGSCGKFLASDGLCGRVFKVVKDGVIEEFGALDSTWRRTREAR